MRKVVYPAKKTRNRIITVIAAVIAIVMAIGGLKDDFARRKKAQEALARTDELFSVHFIDVGQGDACLIKSPDGKFMLIDSGTTESSQYLLKYLEDYNAHALEYFIITHPHEDHYGGASEVIQNIKIENFVILEDFSEVYPYDKFIYMIENSKLSADAEILAVKKDDEFSFADCADFKIISPEQADSDDYNESSLAIKLVFGSTSFLFTGDAEKGSERAMISNGYNLKADVYKAGHHGSSTSSTKSFVSAVSPEFAVISCAKDNSYGHPHEDTLETFGELGVKCFRTDRDGDIVFVSDGEKVKYLDNNGESYNKNDSVFFGDNAA